jgi:hypothetical protein
MLRKDLHWKHERGCPASTKCAVSDDVLCCSQAVVDLEQQLGEKQREVEEAERAEQEAGEAFLAKK